MRDNLSIFFFHDECFFVSCPRLWKLFPAFFENFYSCYPSLIFIYGVRLELGSFSPTYIELFQNHLLKRFSSPVEFLDTFVKNRPYVYMGLFLDLLFFFTDLFVNIYWTINLKSVHFLNVNYTPVTTHDQKILFYIWVMLAKHR